MSSPKETNGRKLSFFHCNVRSLRNKIHELEAFLLDKHFDIVAITEHWLIKEELDCLFINNYVVGNYTSREQYRGGGALILVNRDNLETKKILTINIEKCIELTCVLIKPYNLYVFIVYRTPSGCFLNFLEALEDALQKIEHNKKMIVAGDFNVYFNTNDQNATTLCDLLESYGLHKTIQNPTRGSACLDNVFVNATDRVTSEILDIDISDHNGQALYFDMDKTQASEKPRVERRVFRPITHKGLQTFSSVVESGSWDFVESLNLSADKKISILANQLKEAYLISFPAKTYYVRQNSLHKVTWFNENLRQMRNRLHFLKDFCSRYSTQENQTAYKNFRKQYRQAIKNGKLKSNDNMIQTAKNPIRSMWNIVNSQRKQTNVKDKVSEIDPDIFNDYFSTIAAQITNEIPQTDIDPIDYLKKAILPEDISFSFMTVPETEVIQVINNLKNKNSTDIYGLSVKMIKTIANFISPLLTRLINQCFFEGKFPSALKKAIVTPIYKKGDDKEVTNYRPISLLPILSKVVEKCMVKQISTYFEQNDIFSKCQFGFRKNRSTTMAILDLISSIMEDFEEGNYNITQFFDLTKAFDCVSHDILLNKLNYYKFDRKSADLIKSYLEHRTQIVKVGNNVSTERVMNLGVPQGSVLGPVLFLIYINDLPLCEPHSNYTQFADDTTTKTRHKSLKEAKQRAAETQLRAKTWFDTNKLSLNANKTQKIIFALREIPDHETQEPVQFLGIHLDPKLRWHVQTDNVCKKLSSVIFLIRNLAGCVSPETLKNAYHALFHSIMTYGILAWGKASSSTRVFGLQRKVVRIMAGISYREDCKGAFRNLKIMTFPAAYTYECLVYVKENESKFNTHHQLHNYPTRHGNDIRAPFVRLKKGQSDPEFTGVKYFNKLPNNIRGLPLASFKKALKNCLIQNIFYSESEFLTCDFNNINFNV